MKSTVGRKSWAWGQTRPSVDLLLPPSWSSNEASGLKQDAWHTGWHPLCTPQVSAESASHTRRAWAAPLPGPADPAHSQKQPGRPSGSTLGEAVLGAWCPSADTGKSPRALPASPAPSREDWSKLPWMTASRTTENTEELQTNRGKCILIPYIPFMKCH